MYYYYYYCPTTNDRLITATHKHADTFDPDDVATIDWQTVDQARTVDVYPAAQYKHSLL